MRLLALSLLSGCWLLAGAAASADELRLDDQQLDQVTAGNELALFVLAGYPEDRVARAAGGLLTELNKALAPQLEAQNATLPPELQAGLDFLASLAPAPEPEPTTETPGDFPPFGPTPPLFETPDFAIPSS